MQAIWMTRKGQIEPDMPRRKPLGRRRRVELREVMNAIL